MSYTITKTNGDTLITIPDTELNNSFGLYLVGRNYAGYGIYLNDNFVTLLENSANDTAPGSPLEGQLWFNTEFKEIQVWSGNIWKRFGHTISSSNAPASTDRNLGDQWWDTSNEQLKIWAGDTTANTTAAFSTNSFEVALATATAVRVGDILTTANVLSNAAVTVTQILSTSNVRLSAAATIFATETVTFTRGSGWQLIAPTYSRTQQITGVFPRSITDVQSISHTVGLIYQKGSIIGAISGDNEYTPAAPDAIARLPIIKPGITLIEDAAPQLVRSVLANVSGSAGFTVVSLTQTTGLAVGDFVITNDIALSSGKTIQEIYANNSIRINATTTLATNDIMVFQRGVNQNNMFHGTVSNAQRLNGKTSDQFATLDTAQLFLSNISVAGNIGVRAAGTVVDNSLLWQNDKDLNIVNTRANGNIQLSTVVSLLGGSPAIVFSISGNTGLIEVRGNPVSANGVSTKNYVDTAQGVVLSSLTANVNALINNAPVNKRDFGNVSAVLDTYANNFVTIDNVLASKANIDAQAFTGVITALTAAPGTNNTQIATTQFVNTAATAVVSSFNANASALATQIDLRANIVSPDLAGVPLTTHVANSDRSRRVATTQFVGNIIDAAVGNTQNGLNSKAPIISPDFLGYPTSEWTAANLQYQASALTAASLNIVVSHPFPNQLATVAFVANVVATMPSANLVPYATRVSPSLEGVPTAPTAPVGTSNLQIATTQFVTERSPVLSINGQTGVVTLNVGDITGAAPLSNPVFTGAPALNFDPPQGQYTTGLATTRWTSNIAANLAPLSNPTFIGSVTVPNPADNSNSTIAATTAWVLGRIAVASTPRWDGAAKFVSTQAPLNQNGINGDIWIRYNN